MRKSLEELIFVGTLKKSYKLFGKEWTFKTLSSDEQLQATSSTGDYDNISRMSAFKIAVLARSLVEIDNIELTDVREKIELLGKMQQPVIDMLYNRFTELQNEQDKALREMDSEIKN